MEALCNIITSFVFLGMETPLRLATSVPSECIVSIAGEIVSYKWNRLLPETTNLPCLLHDNNQVRHMPEYQPMWEVNWCKDCLKLRAKYCIVFWQLWFIATIFNVGLYYDSGNELKLFQFKVLICVGLIFFLISWFSHLKLFYLFGQVKIRLSLTEVCSPHFSSERCLFIFLEV